MGCKWDDVDVDARRALVSQVNAMLGSGTLTDIGISGFATGSGKMGYRWHEDEEVRSLFYDRLWSMLERVNGSDLVIDNRELANIIYGMGEVGVDWQRVPERVRGGLLRRAGKCSASRDDFFCQQVTNILTG